MKRSEFIELMGLYMTPEGRGDLVAELESENGVKWDPEESELPKRLNFIDRLELPPCASLETTPGWIVVEAVGRPDHSKHPGVAFTGPLLAAMVDAYNKLQAGELVEASVSAEEILKLLHERDNLKQSLDVAIRERDHLNRLLKCERDLVARLEERLKGVDALQERDVALAELRETRLLLRDIAAAVGLSWRPHETWAECSQLALDIRAAIVAHQRPADVISKTRGGRTVHYAIGPTRETREEAERDLREWFDKEAS